MGIPFMLTFAASTINGAKTQQERLRLRRGLVLLAVVAGHVLLVALLLLARGAPTPVPVATGLQLFVLSAKSGASASPVAPKQTDAPAPPPRPSPIVLPVSPPKTGGGAAGSAAGAASATEGGCAITNTIGSAIESDPLAVAALLALPPEALSKADAVNLWNGQWLQVPAPDGTDSLAGIHVIVEQAFVESPTGCVEATLSGPQFIYVKAGDRTISLVVGSGNWRWADLTQKASYEETAPLDASIPPLTNK